MFQLITRRFLVPLFLGAVAAAGCSSSSGGQPSVTVTSQAVSVDRTAQPPMSWIDGTSLTPYAIEGTYGDKCTIHAGKQWSLVLNQPGNHGLEVASGDTFASCPLTLTGIQTRLGTTRISEFTLDPAIVLGPAFSLNASSAKGPGGVLGFYANARLSNLNRLAYTNDFSIVFVFSDQAAAAGATAPPAIYGQVGASANGAAAPSPDYTLGFDDLVIVVDPDNVVQGSSSGHVTLTFGSQVGEEWKTFDQTLPCCRFVTFGAIDALYTGTSAIAMGKLDGESNARIPVQNFDLTGHALPAWRTLVVKHLGDGAVTSYQLFTIQFPQPTGEVPGAGCSTTPRGASGYGFVLLAGLALAATALVRRSRS